MNTPAAHLLEQILGERPPPFAILFRPSLGPQPPPDPVADVMMGDVAEFARLADLPVDDPQGPPVLAVVPFRQLTERDFDVIDDGAPLLGLRAGARAQIGLDELLARLPADAGPFRETGYDVPDDVYRQTVADVLEDEIAAGEGSNFVIHRAVTGHVAQPPARAALGALRQLLTRERHAYWTFVVHTPGSTFVGATPERHVSLDAGIARMNPISGTLRYPAAGWSSARDRQAAVLAFLADAKERDELWMVLDEELKMMAHVGDLGGRVAGPYLKEMAHLAHTEYVLEGRTSLDARDVLAATMFAPTVTGSPIRNACRVIARHEGRGRGYYGGVLALLDHDAAGRQRLDAPILIRTAQISSDGTVRIPAGATLVRGSQPDAELAETRAKAAAILGAFRGTAPAVPAAPAQPQAPAPGLSTDPAVMQALSGRNRTLARFWLTEQGSRSGGAGEITVVDAEDDFTAMLAHLLRSMGLRVTLLPWQAEAGPELMELTRLPAPVVLGPGPGDPADVGSERIAVLHGLARTRLAAGLPTLGICLGHQVLGLELGLRVRRLPFPDQGLQAAVSVFGHPQFVGFYNSFVVEPPAQPLPGFRMDVTDGRIVAMRGPAVAGLQFHPESVLTSSGELILAEALRFVCAGAIQPMPTIGA